MLPLYFFKGRSSDATCCGDNFYMGIWNGEACLRSFNFVLSTISASLLKLCNKIDVQRFCKSIIYLLPIFDPRYPSIISRSWCMRKTSNRPLFWLKLMERWGEKTRTAIFQFPPSFTLSTSFWIFTIYHILLTKVWQKKSVFLKKIKINITGLVSTISY